MKRTSYLSNRPRTTTTIWDIKRMFKKHPIKTTLALPVATLALCGQLILYYTSVPIVVFNDFISSV